MPRASRRRRDAAEPAPGRPSGRTGGVRGLSGLGGIERHETHSDGEWVVRRVSGARATRPYRCPGCQQEVVPGTPHVVAWPADGVGGVENRRHWHSPCWAARGRRQPRGSSR